MSRDEPRVFTAQAKLELSPIFLHPTPPTWIPLQLGTGHQSVGMRSPRIRRSHRPQNQKPSRIPRLPWMRKSQRSQRLTLMTPLHRNKLPPSVVNTMGLVLAESVSRQQSPNSQRLPRLRSVLQQSRPNRFMHPTTP